MARRERGCSLSPGLAVTSDLSTLGVGAANELEQVSSFIPHVIILHQFNARPVGARGVEGEVRHFHFLPQ